MLTVTVVEVCVASVCRIFPVFFFSFYSSWAWLLTLHSFCMDQTSSRSFIQHGPTNKHAHTHRRTLASVLSTPIHMHTILHRFSSLSLQICSMCVYCIAFFVGHSFLAVSFSSFRSRHSREFSLPMFFLKFTRAVFLFQSFNCIALNEKCIDS